MENQNISDTLNLIATLQKNACCNDNNCISGCTRPFLGPSDTSICFNTRPIQLFSCGSDNAWTMPYDINGTTGESNVFRIENVDNNCATFRVLIPNTVEEETTYTLSNSYFTIDLSCILAMQCLPDIYAI